MNIFKEIILKNDEIKKILKKFKKWNIIIYF